MISNRQGGRRRGRGGQRSQSFGGQSGGNRQDNRQRGNAAQLLEKYKSMARDAQLAGDRVQMEYYQQYAEHYFRVLNESRARFEEQRRQRGDDSDESDEDEELEAAGEQDSDEEQEDERPQRQDRRERSDRSRRSGRDERREGRRDGNGSERVNGDAERIALESLPPAIGRDEDEQDEQGEESGEEAKRPRRRARRPRAADGEGEIAPAA